MKILVLCKRRPLSRDLWQRPYGRFFHLSQGLGQLGHEVHVVLLNYQREATFRTERDGIIWHSVNLLPNPQNYYRYVKNLARQQKADWIIGFSDTYFGICAQQVAHSVGARALVDAYDNYESYIPWCKPLHWLWRRSLRRSDALSAAGPTLLQKMQQGRHQNADMDCILTMAADPQFCPGSKLEARQRLGLPEDKFLVGYSGSIFSNRGINVMFEALHAVAKKHPRLDFALSGRINVKLQAPGNTHWLGYLDDELMPDVLRSFDVLIAVNQDSAFGNYSYPVKIYEALACGTPVLASNTPSTAFVLEKYPQALFDAGDPQALTDCLERFLQEPFTVNVQAAGWWRQVQGLQRLLIRSVG